jgi:hypothetical protein
MLAVWAAAGLSLMLAAAPPGYCTGQPVTDDSGVPYDANGQRVLDGFGKERYPNGARLTNDYGDEIYYSNGARVRSATGDLLSPNGAAVKSASGQVRYPNGQDARMSSATCYFENGVEMNPCQLVVPIHDLDIAAGTIDLRRVRYEFPAATAVISLTADLAAGRLDRGSISAVCPSRS